MDVAPQQSAPAARILIVDDDPGVREVLSDFLGGHGYAVETAADGRSMDAAVATFAPDLIVLDLMMPGEDGLSICKRLSAEPGSPAVIMLSAMGEETDRIVGLELGADDYLPKPCSPRELLARTKAVLRRRRETPPTDGSTSVIEFDGWTLDLVRRELRSAAGIVVNLSGGEFHLLRVLVERPGRVLTRDQLLDLARGPASEAFDRAIDVQISRLRRKLEDGAGRDPIRTVRGEGYMFAGSVKRR
ncbi:MAG: response regulator [Caulobacteraceae bacterium]|nr:response regulator [Caulobacteraceae bacterium]